MRKLCLIKCSYSLLKTVSFVYDYKLMSELTALMLHFIVISTKESTKISKQSLLTACRHKLFQNPPH